MYEASLAEVLRVILIILLVYFGFKILIRFLGPILLKYILKKAGKQFEKKFGNFQSPHNPKKEGEVSIEKKPKSRRKSKNDVGEYVDYEELE